MSWEVKTTPVSVSGFKPTANLEIDSTKVDPDKLAALEAILYGTNASGTEGEEGYVPGTEPRLPLPDEVAKLLGTQG